MMKLKYHGVSFEYNPPKVTYPNSSTSDAIKEQARFLTLNDRERIENRQRSMLMRALHKVELDVNGSEYSDQVAFS
jgi:hypothetical protein